MRIIDTEVAVVGGGAAGSYAALELHRRGIRATVICKGFVGKSGASLFAGNLVVSGRVLGNTEQQAHDTAEFLVKYHNQYLIDQGWARRCGEWIATEYYRELEEAGLYFRRDDAGDVVTSPGVVRSIAANRQGNSGVPFMDLRRKQLIRAHVPCIEEVAATQLMMGRDGSVGGVFCLNYAVGEYVLVRARAVILATGYSDRLHRRSTGTREMSADGLAMAWRAGAAVVNLEMQWWHTSDVAEPPSWQRMQVYPNPILGSEKSARMVNSHGIEFFNQQRDDPQAFGPYTLQLKALVREVRAGRARYDGGYFSGFDHCDQTEVERHTTYGKMWRQLGLSLQHDLLETSVTAHYRQGGILVDPHTMRTELRGLYVAGGLGGHCNGLIALATFDGKVAAETIAGDLEQLSAVAIPDDAPANEINRLEALLRSGTGPNPHEIKASIQEIMWEHAGVEKDADGMSAGLARIETLRADTLRQMSVRNPSRCMNLEWLEAIDTINMVDAAELILRSSLQRTESRGPFIRTDFPKTDNLNWLAANVMRRSGGNVVFEQRPYDTSIFCPEFSVRDNLEVPW